MDSALLCTDVNSIAARKSLHRLGFGVTLANSISSTAFAI